VGQITTTVKVDKALPCIDGQFASQVDQGYTFDTPICCKQWADSVGRQVCIMDKLKKSANMKDLEMRFHKSVIGIYQAAKDECHYNATCFLQMLSDRGGLATARALLATENVSDGFTTLWELGRLDLAVEAHVLKPEFSDLFTEEEKLIAKRRLEEYGYEPQ
jgi:hypothetical protein